jgi:DNA-binding helix-hairpin-helix protein with protein kinase domain
MHELLKIGQTVTSVPAGIPCTVDQYLGGGGQGEVYRATMAGGPIAIKWYFPHTATPEQRQAIDELVKSRAPDPRFLWPLDLLVSRGSPTFGYSMPLRAPGLKTIIDVMKRRADPTFRTLATAGFQLADCYLALHSRGLCYRDISFGNVFFDPGTGDVLICDNDNVAVDGRSSGGVLGTPRFMAPEVVRCERRPSTQTDLFSLSVLLFYMLVGHHPLEGAKEAAIHCLDLPAMNKLYGSEPLFIFDPVDKSNRPVDGYHQNALAAWPILPSFLQDIFTRAFTEGVRDPERRVRESEWKGATIRLRDSVFHCAACSAENFFDDAASTNPRTRNCWHCKRPLQSPVRIRLGKQVVMLNRDTKLYPHHVRPASMYDFSTPIAEVTRHPTDPNVWGLKNLSQLAWTCTTAAGVSQEVAPGRSLTVTRGTRVKIDTSEGELIA